MIKNCVKLVSPLRTIMTTSVAHNSSFALMFKDYGDPLKVIEKVDTSNQVSLNKPLDANQVLIQFLASTINPSDINTVQGTYAVKPTFPAIGGNEGVAKVIKVGSAVNKLKPDDWVIPAKTGFGTWRTHAIATDNDLMQVDKGLDINAAAQLSVNPPTAYRMLKDYVKLKPGDCVLQNGANSAVGLLVIQLCKEWDLKTINVVRSRPNPNEMTKLISELKDLGADYVVTEEDLRNRDIMGKIWSNGISKPALCLNCIGGDNATNCIRHMADEATMVTYGAMSKKPLIIPAGPIIFNNLKFTGFWMTRWKKEHAGKPEYYDMMEKLTNLFKQGKLIAPKVIPFKMDNYREAIDKAMKPFVEGKVVLTTE